MNFRPLVPLACAMTFACAVLSQEPEPEPASNLSTPYRSSRRGSVRTTPLNPPAAPVVTPKQTGPASLEASQFSRNIEVRTTEPEPRNLKIVSTTVATPEQARAALVEAIKRSPVDQVKRTLADVTNAKIVPSQVGGDWFEIGPWTYTPKRGKVNLHVGGNLSFWRYEGTLKRLSNGGWQVIDLRGGHVCRLPAHFPPSEER